MQQKNSPERSYELPSPRAALQMVLAAGMLTLAAGKAQAAEVDICAAERRRAEQAESQHCLSREGAPDCEAGRVQSVEIDTDNLVFRTANEYLSAARELHECEQAARKTEILLRLRYYLGVPVVLQDN